MSSFIEPAKSGRASCRKCKEKIEKGELRFGYEDVSDEFTSLKWYHLMCGAQTFPKQFLPSLEDFEGDIPNRDALEEAAKSNKSKQKPSEFPYAERAPSARSTCQICEEKIAKDELRIAIEREIDTGSFVRTGAGYLHPTCATQHEEGSDLEEFFTAIEENSTSLEDPDLEELAGQFGVG